VLKSDIEIAPVYRRLLKRTRAHGLGCFLALLLQRVTLSKRLDRFRSKVCHAWRHALLRRSQRHRLSWDRFNRLARRDTPYCRQMHPYPEQRFAASRP
jgi:hypothetical protein